MLYHLLYPLHEQYGIFNLFRYITFRAMLAFIISFLIVLCFQPLFIRILNKRGGAQPIRNDGPKSHETKAGTPTMGGLLVILSVIFSVILLCDLTNRYVWISIGTMSAYAALGFVDDRRKVLLQDSKGISGRQKLFWQGLFAFLVGVGLMYLGFSTELRFPFLKGLFVDMGWVFVPFVMLVIVGTSNAVNLTDGLDGLAIGPVMTVAATYAIFAYLGGHSKLAQYLAIPYVPGVGELTIVLSAIVAAGLGFLWYNTFPAQIFMGDIGALSLGATLGLVAVLVKQELVLVLAGGVFVIEAVSVIIQVYSFKLTGKRVFRMAPIHHHFEEKGWKEPKIIVRFWIISIVLAIFSLTTLKIR
ncbi:MAG: phospho-N-acetylmuramoyl-pentapeptide-transferase [Candidatus Dadabacteria bacterium]|nr:MAG: phospho-N-acetylmuramoyl-pentapeptide-transferase [Candidatus Dadabacteria bacterium]